MVLMVIVLGLAATALGALVDPTKQIVLIGDSGAFQIVPAARGRSCTARGCDRFGIGRGLFWVQVESTEHAVLAPDLVKLTHQSVRSRCTSFRNPTEIDVGLSQ